MKRITLYLVIGIPAAAVLMGVVTLYVAFRYADSPVPTADPAMSKTSWQRPADDC